MELQPQSGSGGTSTNRSNDRPDLVTVGGQPSNGMEEIAVVQRIFHEFANEHRSLSSIADTRHECGFAIDIPQ